MMANLGSVREICNCDPKCSISFILPSGEADIVSAIVVSKWENIVGPESVHIWLQKTESSVTENFIKSAVSNSTSVSKSRTKNNHSHCILDALLKLESVKYVTNHTVNYTGVRMLDSSSAHKKISNLFVVPQLNLLAQCLTFWIHIEDLSVPCSLGVLVNYKHYNKFLQFRHVFEQWLWNMSFSIKRNLHQCIESGTAFKEDGDMTESVHSLCSVVTSVNAIHRTQLNALHHTSMFIRHLLPLALTSHLQTRGFTLVLGNVLSDINKLTSFLSLFLDGQESDMCQVRSLNKSNFIFGIRLQGMLSKEFDYQTFLSANVKLPAPVTLIDTSYFTVKQVYSTSAFNFGNSDLNSQKIFSSVKQSAAMVETFLDDIRLIPQSKWKVFVNMFKQKLHVLASTLLNLVSTKQCSTDSFCSIQTLCKQLGVNETDFLIILSAAQKLKPGIHKNILYLDSNCL